MSLVSYEKFSMTNTDLLENNYFCIHCGGSLNFNNNYLTCKNCSVKFEIRNGIPILADTERYWCNFSKEKMQKLNEDSKNSHWKEALKKHLEGNVLDHVSSEKRIDFRYILPSLKDKRLLDVGSMWGGITIPLSKYAGEIYAIDTTFETLEFLSIRARQDEINNIKFALASARRLPFSDEYFDMVLLIGVLEWLGDSYDFVVTEHYGKLRRDRSSKTADPKELQRKALIEANRVLKPHGKILIGIENRFFYKHFFSYPDPHTATPFSSILPRKIADIYMRLLKGHDYTEYTYSYRGYKKLLGSSNFKIIDIYAAIPSYRELSFIVSLDDSWYINYYYNNFGLRRSYGLKRFIPKVIINFNLMKYFVPSYLILAEKI